MDTTSHTEYGSLLVCLLTSSRIYSLPIMMYVHSRYIHTSTQNEFNVPSLIAYRKKLVCVRGQATIKKEGVRPEWTFAFLQIPWPNLRKRKRK